ncbi:MAG TPA: cysteine--tRNA ligase [Dehalococcoidia bacterium]|mgnify:CR=1 FL=1|nr:cysteine--tRNA ligase [Dehalococcoidia bacterium]
MLELYNTLTRKKSALRPHEKGKFSIYTCGPTVYRDAHIGNLRSYLMADWIRRTLQILGNEVTHIKNITDVGHMRQEVLEQGEDKVIAAAIAEGKTPAQIAEFYTHRFLTDELAINILPADEFPKATDHVTEMIEITESLLQSGFAYEVKGNIYYDVNSFSTYGNLSGNVHESELQEAVRIESDPLKKDPRDFTLWKKAEEGRSLKWASPWGDGFPGWHIECSAMSIKYLGRNIDVHTGGVDNIFPHHEGEIAQSEGYTGTQVVSHWVHGQHLLADGVKMAKSAGNAFIISDLVERGIDPLAFRYLCMTARYRTRINFTFTSLKACETALNKLRRHYILFRKDSDKLIPEYDKIEEWHTRFINKVCEDLDMPGLLDAVWRLVESSDISNSGKAEVLRRIDKLMGLGLDSTPDMYDLPDVIVCKSRKRNSLRDSSNYEESDLIRDEMEAEGYLIEDSDNHSIVRTKNASEIREDKWKTISSSSEVFSSIAEESLIPTTIGVVVTGYPDDTRRCISSVLEWTESDKTEIIVVDNGSSDSTGELLEEMSGKYSNLKVVHADHTLGDGSAKNVLLKIARGEILILLDPSVEIKGPFIDRIHELLIPSTVGIVGLAGLRTKDLLHFHDGDGESGNMDAMQGYCFALRRCDLEKVGLMRESFRYYRNLDLDFSFQFKERGYSIVADHTLPMELHEHRGWTALSQGEREELSKKNYGRFLKKWRNRTDLLISTK